MMMINYLLFIYLLRYLYDSNKDSFRIYFKQFVCVPYIQNRLLTNVVATAFPEFASKLYFKITNIDFAELDNEYNLEKINKLSKDYKHLIPVSQQLFADKIFTEINNTDKPRKTPINFKLSAKKVIDIVRLLDINQNKQKSNNFILFDPDNTLTTVEDENTEYNLLNYKLLSNNGSKVITNAYQKILDYIRNPSSILIMSETETPKEIKNLFEIISKKILNSSRITKDMISTFSYYNILLENIPNPQNFKHTTFLYIIYQLIIPYHYDIYNNSQFEDVFL
jgi:hypothetical protein